MNGSSFDPKCRRCPRLTDFLAEIRESHPSYHCAPVAPFGDPLGRLLIVGLAPGMHGANASGRPFTGDYAGILLYQTLYRFGFSNQAQSRSLDDGLSLSGCRITNAVKCLPPNNKPLTNEIRNCNGYLSRELSGLPRRAVVLALGLVAHNAVLRARGLRLSGYRFGHGSLHDLEGQLWLLDSYHCSRYNTQTGRLTESGFHSVFERAKALLEIA